MSTEAKTALEHFLEAYNSLTNDDKHTWLKQQEIRIPNLKIPYSACTLDHASGIWGQMTPNQKDIVLDFILYRDAFNESLWDDDDEPLTID